MKLRLNPNSFSSLCRSPRRITYVSLEIAIVVYFLVSLTITKYYIMYIKPMPIITTRFDYILTTILFIGLILSFFVWSTWGDQHYSTNSGVTQETAFTSKMNMAVYVIPLFLIYEWFTIYYFNGMPRLRELPKGLLLLRLRLLINKKIQEGTDDYKKWKSR